MYDSQLCSLLSLSGACTAVNLQYTPHRDRTILHGSLHCKAALWYGHRLQSCDCNAFSEVLVQEILGNASLVEKIANTTAIAEVKALDDFFQMLAVDSAKAFYGPGHVIAAAGQGAVAKLLIADSLYRCYSHSHLSSLML